MTYHNKSTTYNYTLRQTLTSNHTTYQSNCLKHSFQLPFELSVEYLDISGITNIFENLYMFNNFWIFNIPHFWIIRCVCDLPYYRAGQVWPKYMIFSANEWAKIIALLYVIGSIYWTDAMTHTQRELPPMSDLPIPARRDNALCYFARTLFQQTKICHAWRYVIGLENKLSNDSINRLIFINFKLKL